MPRNPTLNATWRVLIDATILVELATIAVMMMREMMR